MRLLMFIMERVIYRYSNGHNENKKRLYVCVDNLLSQVVDLAAPTSHVVCLHFAYELQHQQFKNDPERQLFEKIFIAIYFLT